MGRAGAAGRHPRSLVGRRGDQLLDPLALTLGDQRPDDGGRIVRVADRDRVGRGRGEVDDLGVASRRNEHPGVGTAHLAGQVHDAGHDPGNDGVEVGVVEHDRGRLATELERHPLHLVTAQAHDALAGRGRSGERDLVGARMGDQVLADLPAARNEVDHARRHAGLLERLDEEVVAQRRLGRWLEHDGAPGRERRRHLPRRDRHRRVPRHDRSHDPDRQLVDQSGPFTLDHATLELEATDEPGVVVEHGRHEAGLGRGTPG